MSGFNMNRGMLNSLTQKKALTRRALFDLFNWIDLFDTRTRFDTFKISGGF